MTDDRERDPDVPEADAQEQSEEWVPEETKPDEIKVDPDVPEADALEQATPAELDDEER